MTLLPANSLKNTYLTLFPCVHLYCLVLYSHAYTSTTLYFFPILTPQLHCTLFPRLHLYCIVLYSHAYTSTVLYFIPMLSPLLPCILFPCLHLYCLILYSHAYTSTFFISYNLKRVVGEGSGLFPKQPCIQYYIILNYENITLALHGLLMLPGKAKFVSCSIISLGLSF